MESNLTEPATAALAAGQPSAGQRPGPCDEVTGSQAIEGFQEGRPTEPARPRPRDEVTGPRMTSAERAVTELYEAHALGMIRLAHIMLGDRQSAEDAVQEAFYGLYRRWSGLSDPDRAVPYVRSAVLNHCRSVLRRRTSSQAPRDLLGHQADVVSAESAVLTGEERREVMAALRQLPRRQREALVLRFYLDLPAEEAATSMGISASSVRSATHRALTALGRMLQERS
jgi:RNA polymerase sigma-70 factor (sigma-E family)